MVRATLLLAGVAVCACVCADCRRKIVGKCCCLRRRRLPLLAAAAELLELVLVEKKMECDWSCCCWAAGVGG